MFLVSVMDFFGSPKSEPRRAYTALLVECDSVDMPGLQKVKLYEYKGSQDANGRGGILQIFELRSANTALQPFTQSHVTATDCVLLNSGYNLPRIGLGTWKSEKGQVKHAVYEALKAGYRHVDCAAIYENEHEVGAAMQQAFTEKIVNRSEVFVTSKLWSDHRVAKLKS